MTAAQHSPVVMISPQAPTNHPRSIVSRNMDATFCPTHTSPLTLDTRIKTPNPPLQTAVHTDAVVQA